MQVPHSAESCPAKAMLYRRQCLGQALNGPRNDRGKLWFSESVGKEAIALLAFCRNGLCPAPRDEKLSQISQSIINPWRMIGIRFK
eukprot:scaffold135892_cov17-Prasinocladus_malaysianus.AAC.1